MSNFYFFRFTKFFVQFKFFELSQNAKLILSKRNDKNINKKNVSKYMNALLHDNSNNKTQINMNINTKISKKIMNKNQTKSNSIILFFQFINEKIMNQNATKLNSILFIFQHINVSKFEKNDD